jgi:dolichyl-diphosphooligosaccharide--protein glycosyltransferase
MGALALAWQGYTYAVVVVALSVLISMIAERIRHVDSFGLYVSAWIVGLVGFAIATPYYLTQYGSVLAPGFETFIIVPAIVMFGVLLLLLPFLLLRDVPWVFSIPALLLLYLAGAAGLAFAFPSYFTSIVTGQGYFVKNLIYSTVAEAQAPSIDELVLGYGIVTFFLAFVGLALFVFQLVRGRFKRIHVVFLVFALLSIYLPISAAKFFLVASPIFALLPAEAIRRALDVGRYPELRRTVASLSDRKSQFAAFRKAFKPRHVLIFVLVLIIVLPNIWVGIDAGIPGNTKSGFAAEIGATLPPWLQLNTSNPASYYLGAAGTSIDTSNQYDSAGYNWLAQQDTNIPAPERPAFVSWWDYGFQAIDQGQHPSVADNFQNGIDPAGQFLLSQNESIAIGVLAATLLVGEQGSSGYTYLSPSLNQILAQDGLNLAKLHTYLVNQSADYTMVVNDPALYLPVDASSLTDQNAMYMVVSYYIAGALPLSGVAKVYDDIQAYTGSSIRYAMSDSRLFPFSGQDTGIYYAPAELTGRVIDSVGSPSTFFNVTVLGTDGNTYAPNDLPAGVGIVQYNINYFTPFYNSMIYHIYIGYNGTQAGLGPGIPGLSLNASIEPGWMLQHFQVVYQTAYYCPSAAEAASNPNCYSAMNTPEAESLAQQNNGSADTSATMYFDGGESFLEYYAGQTLLGDVTLPDGTAVSGARVTVDDGWGIPHMTTTTAKDGSYSLVLPPGNDTVNITIGTFNPLTQQDNVVLKSLAIDVPNAIGLSYSAPNLVQYAPGETAIPGAQVVLWGQNLTRITTTTDLSGTFRLANVPAGIYNVSLLYAGHNYTETALTAQPTIPANESLGISTATISGFVEQGGVTVPGAVVTVSGTGPTVSNVSTSGGNFTIGNFGPGNFTVVASIPGTDLRSAGAFVRVTSPGTQITLNLTLEPTAPVSVLVTSGGRAAAGIPVRFVAQPDFTNASLSPLAALGAAASNGTVVTTGANGLATAVLPIGSYSVYALGYTSSGLSAGLATVSALSSRTSPTVALALQPAARLAGNVTGSSLGSTGTATAVLAYSSAGTMALALGNATGAYALYLPAGSYNILGLQGGTTTGSTIYAALTSVTLTGPTALALAGSPAVAVHLQVGSATATGGVFPAAGAAVTVSFGTTGAAVPTFANANGTVGLYVPSQLPLSSLSYCVGATATGFGSASVCDLTPSNLGTLTSLPLSLTPVALTVRVTGLPGGTSVTVNLTATSASATTVSLTGGPNFAVSVAPGSYAVTARAATSNGSVLYLPATAISTTLALGAGTARLTIPVLPEINATGKLTLPAGATVATTTVALSSATLNVTVNGTAFTGGFYVAVGSYSVYANVSVSGAQYTALGKLTVPSNGIIGTAVAITTPGVDVSGSLLQPGGSALVANTTVVLTNPSGAVVLAAAPSGTFSAVLPPGVLYSTSASAVTSIAGPNGTYLATWTSTAGSACSPTTSSPDCAVPLTPSTQRVWLNGTLVASGVPGTVPATLRLVGPYPYENLTVVNASAGTFAVSVLPGSYSIYASGGGVSDLLANFTTALALPSTTGNLTLSLAPTWIDTVRIAAPNGTAVPPTSANLTVRSPFGGATMFSGVALGAPVSIALPVGSFALTATAVGNPYGVSTLALGTAVANVVAGNLGSNLWLSYRLVPAATGGIVGRSTLTVSAPSTVSFAFTVRNSGNLPIVVHPVGAPAYWTFQFSIGNVSLSVGGGSVSGEATVTVPAGTLVSHPTIAIEFALANGTVVGEVTPGPEITVVGYYGIGAGPTPPSSPAQIGESSARVPIYVANTGNQGETVAFSLVNANQLAGMGWSSNFTRLGVNLTASQGYLTAGENSTWFVLLNATGPIFVPPGSVTVELTVLNSSGAVRTTVTVAVPFGEVHPSGPNGTNPITVTGPVIGTPPSSLPDWVIPVLVFVPTFVLIGGVLLYRWNRSRRWSRR